MKIVYLWKNGKPVVVFKNDDDEYEYPSDKWTEDKPTDGLYAPIYYDGKEWIGQTKEEFEKTVIPTKVEPDEKDMVIEDLTEQLAKTNAEVDSLKTAFVDLTEQIASIQGGNLNG
ncbi:hypothetical protein [Staphylococcus caledonicus]|uniref:hypothetical protein n=1 Tax=Staphylococcus caledonicus TaxID=2741333 RepID=UPI0018E43016|nr:hypothetical protein [Staphylococcus caledonicus]MBI5972234.1 hypothetical protein [Staphylococcus caledonicus]